MDFFVLKTSAKLILVSFRRIRDSFRQGLKTNKHTINQARNQEDLKHIPE